MRYYMNRVFIRLPKPFKTAFRGLRWGLRWVRWKFFSRHGYQHPSMLINENELQVQYQQAIKYLKEKLGSENIGNYLEFGVYKGNSLLLMYNELNKAGLTNVRLFGFDSFEGLPQDEEGLWEKGQFSSDYNNVIKFLDQNNVDRKRVELVKGFFSDTLTNDLVNYHNLHKVSLIMIDCDIYSSAKEALNFCRPLIGDEAVIFFDDWNPLAKVNKGEKRAFDEFLSENPEFKTVAIGTYNLMPGDLAGKVFRISRL